MDVPDAWGWICHLSVGGGSKEEEEEEAKAGGGRQRGRILVVARRASEGRDPVYDGRQQLDDGLSNPLCVFLFMFLALMMLMI